MNKNNINFNLLELHVSSILTHLNMTCSFGPQFQQSTIDNQQERKPYIQLLDGYINNNQQITQKQNTIIHQLQYVLPIVCDKQIQMVKQMKNTIIPTAFKLEFQIDQGTQQNILIPFKLLNKDKLILCPMFCDFYTYIEAINYQKSTNYEISKIDADEYYVILLLWNLRKILNYKQRNNSSFELILYPQQHSFGICKIEDSIEQFCFYSNLQKKSNKITEALKTKRIRELQIKLFEILQSDITIMKSQYIEKKFRQNLIIRQKLDQNLIDELEIKYGIKNQNVFQIKGRNSIPIQSTLCLTGQIEEDLNHRIQFQQNSNPICVCGKEIDSYCGDTLIIDYCLKEAVDQIIIELQMDLNLDYTIFLIPLFLEIEIDQYENEWIILFFKDKNNNKVQLKKLMFKAKMYNYDIDLISDNEEDQEKLFGGTDVYDIQASQIEKEQSIYHKISNEQDIQSFWKQNLDYQN